MPISFNRTLRVEVEAQGSREVFTYPQPGLGGNPSQMLGGLGLRMTFSVTKTWTQAPNTCTLSIYNLEAASRARLITPRALITISAGYLGLEGDNESTLGVIFKGTVRDASDSKNRVNRITTITADTSQGYGQVTLAGRQDSPTVDVLKEALKKLQGVDVAKALKTLGELTFNEGAEKFHKGASFSGDAWEIVNQLMDFTNGAASVQDGELVIDYLQRRTTAVFLSPATGLIGTPTLSTTIKTDYLALTQFRCLMQPKILPGSLVETQLELGGGEIGTTVSKVRTVTHSGDTQGAGWYTDVEALVTELSGYEANDAVTVETQAPA